jgi:hypothetical protein
VTFKFDVLVGMSIGGASRSAGRYIQRVSDVTEVTAVKRTLARAAIFALALVMLLGPSVASANPWDAYAGQTFAKVSERTQGRAVIASRVGSYLPTEECIVTGSRRTSFLDSSGNGNTTILVDLNCNDPKSAGGDGRDHPGNSVASPAGAKMADLKDRAARLSTNYANAVKAGKPPACEKSFDGCKRICEQTGACSAELNSYLGL